MITPKSNFGLTNTEQKRKKQRRKPRRKGKTMEKLAIGFLVMFALFSISACKVEYDPPAQGVDIIGCTCPTISSTSTSTIEKMVGIYGEETVKSYLQSTYGCYCPAATDGDKDFEGIATDGDSQLSCNAICGVANHCELLVGYGITREVCQGACESGNSIFTSIFTEERKDCYINSVNCDQLVNCLNGGTNAPDLVIKMNGTGIKSLQLARYRQCGTVGVYTYDQKYSAPERNDSCHQFAPNPVWGDSDHNPVWEKVSGGETITVKSLPNGRFAPMVYWGGALLDCGDCACVATPEEVRLEVIVKGKSCGVYTTKIAEHDLFRPFQIFYLAGSSLSCSMVSPAYWTQQVHMSDNLEWLELNPTRSDFNTTPTSGWCQDPSSPTDCGEICGLLSR